MSSFRSADAYSKFADQVKRTTKSFLDSDATDFLTALDHQAEKLRETIPAGSVFWRAQRAHEIYPLEEDGQYIDDIPGPSGPQRMVPPRDGAFGGRTNPPGIRHLYLATHQTTALSEVKAPMGSLISVAQFEIRRDLTIINVTTDERPKHLSRKVPEEEIDQVVLYRIDEAFSKPVILPADYVPTQIMAGFFRTMGFNGVGYKSSFGYGYNIALFDITDAKWRNCFLFEKNITLEFRERAAPIYSSHQTATSTRTLLEAVREN